MKTRLDLLLVQRGLAPSRERARAFIMAGEVFVTGERLDKPGMQVEEACGIEIKSDPIPFVSRGGLKLAKAISEFKISLEGDCCLDIGASTGGFTDCMLQNGAEKVFAVDTGYGQLDYRLRKDERVVCMERTNFRYSKPADFPAPFDFASADVSFISLEKILPAAFACLKETGKMVCLIKPQFEAGREKVGKHGVVRDKEVHLEVIRKILFFAEETGFQALGLSWSPIQGPKGNIEYLLYLQKGMSFAQSITEAQMKEAVEAAHRHFA
ncbi:MAG: TlyA family RNA methyltransferase [Lachnospiraceae bacterium]|nr:TlyA family RNA methyltransferase [Lachnospiraceae bacterium]